MSTLVAYRNRLTLAGYRPSTVTARMQVLTAFAREVEPRQLEAATRRDVEAFLARPLAPQSRRAYRSHLRAFYGWLIDEEDITVDPTAKIPAVRVPAGTPRPLSDDDLHLALTQAEPRMRAWLLLMALAGLRCMEVARLRPCDLMEASGAVVLFLRECKGGGTSTVPAHQAIVAALADLPVRDGLWWDVQPETVSKQVSAYLRARGIDATAHGLRHSAASAWIKASGYDLLTTSRLLRHANVGTTQVYARLGEERPAEVVHAVHLRAV